MWLAWFVPWIACVQQWVRRRVFLSAGPDDHGPSPYETPGSTGPGHGGWVLVGFVGLSLLVGATAAAVTAPGVRGWYLSLMRPPGTPPDWVFAPVWTILYILMGLAAWLVWRRGRRMGVEGRTALRLWGWQLLVNALWSPVFFALHSPAAALLVIVVLLALIAISLRAFLRIRPLAGCLLLPYLAWVCYATYLNAGFWWLNRA